MHQILILFCCNVGCNVRVDVPMHVGYMIFYFGGLQFCLVISEILNLVNWPMFAEWEVWETQ